MSDERQLNEAFHFIMTEMISTGRAPFYTDLAHHLGVSMDEGRKILHDLFSTGIPGWLFPNTDHIASFAPFNNLPTQYRVTITGEQKWFAQ